MSVSDLLTNINAEDKTVLLAVKKELQNIGVWITQILQSINLVDIFIFLMQQKVDY